MRNWPTWLPNPGSWMNALFLTLLMGVVASGIKFTGQMGQVLYQHFASRLGLTFGVLAILLEKRTAKTRTLAWAGPPT